MSYTLVCGIETHIELATATKIFCGCATAFGGQPNTRCCPVCTGQPGSLPVLNRRVVEYAIRAGLAVNCTINEVASLDRKNYFYPDLPKAYQISQYDRPICENGCIALDGGKRIRIKRIHIEEDAGKLIHIGGRTLVDYNRCGVPLIEVVTEPDIETPAQAGEYIEKLQAIMRAIGISDCRMQEGSLRCDVNVSVGGEGISSARTEIKNMNSVSQIVRAIEYEYSRQLSVIEGGGRVERATLRFDERTGSTFVMRGKEDSGDYRYFPEPDLPAILIPRELVAEISACLPELPAARAERYVKELGMDEANARLICRYNAVAVFAERVFSLGADVRTATNLIVGTLYSLLSTEDEREKFDIFVTAEDFAELAELVAGGKIGVTLAQMTLTEMVSSRRPLADFRGRLEGMDENQLEDLCRKAIESNPRVVDDFLSGKEKALSGLFGFIKKQSQGRADIREAERVLRRLLKEKQ